MLPQISDSTINTLDTEILYLFFQFPLLGDNGPEAPARTSLPLGLSCVAPFAVFLTP